VSEDRLLDAAEVAELLNVPERWVREHTRSGFIPKVALGRYIRYRREAVLAWIAEQEGAGAAWRRQRPRAAAVPAGTSK
jgi:excisionase family DNA binding protein